MEVEKLNYSIENILHVPELFDYLLNYLDSGSALQLLYSSNLLYNRYMYNDFIVQQIIKKIEIELRLQCVVNHIYLSLDFKEKRLFFHDIISFYFYFIHFKYNYIGIGHIISFLVDRNKRYNTSYILFEHLMVESNKYSSNPRFRNLNGIDLNELPNLITNCDTKQLLIFFQQLVIPKNIICTSIKSMLNSENPDTDKLKDCVHYFLVKSTFGNRRSRNNSNDYFLNDILHEIVLNNNIILLDYILKKRDYLRIYFDYTNILLKCIELDRRDMMDKILSYHDTFFTNKKPMFVTGNVVKDIVKRGSFQTLFWVVDNLLGKMVNLNVYIMCIIDGLNNCKNIEKIEYLFYLYNYLNIHSKNRINDTLQLMYSKFEISFYKKIYFNTLINN